MPRTSFHALLVVVLCVCCWGSCGDNGGGPIEPEIPPDKVGVLFDARESYKVGEQPMVLCTADFNGDGYNDLATGNERYFSDHCLQHVDFCVYSRALPHSHEPDRRQCSRIRGEYT